MPRWIKEWWPLLAILAGAVYLGAAFMFPETFLD
jgi:hypothetical protein